MCAQTFWPGFENFTKLLHISAKTVIPVSNPVQTCADLRKCFLL